MHASTMPCEDQDEAHHWKGLQRDVNWLKRSPIASKAPTFIACPSLRATTRAPQAQTRHVQHHGEVKARNAAAQQAATRTQELWRSGLADKLESAKQRTVSAGGGVTWSGVGSSACVLHACVRVS